MFRFQRDISVCDECGSVQSTSLFKAIPCFHDNMLRRWKPDWQLCGDCYLNLQGPIAVRCSGEPNGWDKPVQPNRVTREYVMETRSA